MYKPTIEQNTGMETNYSTATATPTATPTSPTYTITTHSGTKNGFVTCEKSYDGEHFLLCISITVYISIFVIIIMAISWFRKYQTMKRIIKPLQNSRLETLSLPSSETDPLEQSSGPDQIITVQLEQNATSASEIKLQSRKTASSSFNKADLTVQQLIRSGQKGVLYKVKMRHGTIKGHTMFTCKVYKNAAEHKQVKREVMIMQNLNTHMNLLQLLDWDITEVPYMLLMEHVEHGSLHTFLMANKQRLCKDEDLQHLFTISLYHIAQALDHLHSKMILHCNLALRNIMVNRFPHEVKVAEFGMARDMANRRSLFRNCKETDTKRVPYRWYPPEYFTLDFYGFEGDVWAFGIVMWEMQTFGTIPYPNLKTLKEVVHYVCAGHRTQKPENCRPEMLQMMKDCWQDPYSMRPAFVDIVRVMENILENDRDYVNMESSAVESKDED